MRVAFLDNRLDPSRPGFSGLSDAVWDMAIALGESGHEVHVIGPFGKHAVPSADVAVHRVGIALRNHLSHIQFVRRAREIIRQNHIDVVHFRDYFLTAFLDVDQPSVVTPPGHIEYRLAHGFEVPPWLDVQVLRWAVRRTARSRVHVVATSESLATWWRSSGVPEDRLSVLPLGFRSEKFYPVSGARLKLPLLDRADGPVLLFVGRFDHEKGIFDALEAVQRERAFHLEHRTKFIFLGSGLQASNMRRFIADHGLSAVLHVGDQVEQRDLPVWYSAADALVFPSRVEPFGKVLVEAQACGLPVIGAHVGGVPDVIVDGGTGYHFAPADTARLAFLLRDAVERVHELRSWRPAIASRATELFSWRVLGKRLVREIYMPMLEGDAAGPPWPASSDDPVGAR